MMRLLAALIQEFLHYIKHCELLNAGPIVFLDAVELSNTTSEVNSTSELSKTELNYE